MTTLGATLKGNRCHFRVWAPRARRVLVAVEGAGPVPMSPGADGYHTTELPGLHAGQRYRYVIDGTALPDPCSRFQPEGPHGPSEIVDPDAYRWRDAGWQGLALEGLVLYELHVGTFTAEGTFDAAAARLGHLRELGITAVEIMPVAECSGRFNWGYDGVAWFAPSHRYGRRDALKAFVDAAHAQGIGVVLDVVYNHFGPDGNYTAAFSPWYRGSRRTEWGESINFDGEHCDPVREMVIANACEWIREFHLDGLRLDATQDISDESGSHVLAELVTAARAAAEGRRILVMTENEPQHATQLLPAGEGGLGIDAMWNDDFHHAARVAATGRRDAYYHDYLGTAQEFVSAAKRGFLYQGQYYLWQKKSRGRPMRHPASRCITYLQNHDQVANSLAGRRLHQMASPALCRALTAVLLLGPQVPLLFMGQEFHASAPFLYFADLPEPLRAKVREGRGDFLSQLPGVGSADGRAALPDPGDEATFLRCKLDWGECTHDNPALCLHRDLLALRRQDPVLREQAAHGLDGAVLGSHAFLLRWFAASGEDRLLVVNLGRDIRERSIAEPLLAPPQGAGWSLVWSSEHARYGGGGTVDPTPDREWRLAGQSAVLLAALPLEEGAA